MNNTWWDKVSIHNIEYNEDPKDEPTPIVWIENSQLKNHKDYEVVGNITC